jgi:Transposase DDE domain group 1
MIVRRVAPTPGSQLWLKGVAYSHYAFITDREGEMLELEADHRQHAVVENVIRDSKYGLALNHMPSGKFGANAAWLALNVIAHNLCRWMGRLGGFAIACLKAWRLRFFSLPGRLVAHGPPTAAAIASRLAVEGGVHGPAGQAPGGRPAVDDLS